MKTQEELNALKNEIGAGESRPDEEDESQQCKKKRFFHKERILMNKNRLFQRGCKGIKKVNGARRKNALRFHFLWNRKMREVGMDVAFSAFGCWLWH